ADLVTSEVDVGDDDPGTVLRDEPQAVRRRRRLAERHQAEAAEDRLDGLAPERVCVDHDRGRLTARVPFALLSDAQTCHGTPDGLGFPSGKGGWKSYPYRYEHVKLMDRPFSIP